MTWTATQGSAIFQQALVNPIALGGNATSGFPTSFAGLVSDTVNCALYGNTGTPDKTAAVASTGYNTGQWTAASDELPGTGGYTQGGKTLTGKGYALDSGSSSLCFTAAQPSWTAATLANVYGCLVYDSTISGVTVAKQGMCFNYFGGAQSVTSGTFTVAWATVGANTGTTVFNIAV